MLYIEAAAFLLPDIEVEIYDIFGRLVIRETTNIRPRGEIGISALTPGIYLLIGRDKKQELGRAKFVVSGK